MWKTVFNSQHQEWKKNSGKLEGKPLDMEKKIEDQGKEKKLRGGYRNENN